MRNSRMFNTPFEMRGRFLLSLFLGLLLASCATIKKVPVKSDKGFHHSSVPADSITAVIPTNQQQLFTVRGKGKAIVDGPKKTHRVTLNFSGNRRKSLITVKNNIGIEGAKILAFGDSLLIYNRVKKYVRKISVKKGSLHGINHLASVNLLKLFNHSVHASNIKQVEENKGSYLLKLQSGGEIFVNKKTHLIQQINQPETAGLPYSRIIYKHYNQIKGLTLPRRITIFSADRSTRIDLLVQALKVNIPLKKLTLNLPKDIKIYHR